jgi:hypothetical protein
MFIASINDKRVSAEEYGKNKLQYEKDSALCPITKGRLTYVSPHFRYKDTPKESYIRSYWRLQDSDSHVVSDKFLFDPEYFQKRNGKVFVGGESQIHMKAKHFIQDLLEQREAAGRFKVEQEYRLELHCGERAGRYRICDVIERFTYGEMIAHECQFSSITPETLEERTRDYEDNGVSVYWYFGGKAETEANKSWWVERFGTPALCFEMIEDESIQ